jgi:DNA invertase Pin-like site-specific DNA recombinase
MGNTTRIVGYARVSTDDRGISLEAQSLKIHQYAELYDLAVTEVILDAGASAKTLERPGLQRVLSMLKRGETDGVLVAKLDRLTRSVRDLGLLLDTSFQGAELMSVAETIDTRSAGGRLILNVLTSVAQWERETISERTKEILRIKAARGLRTSGHIPYGQQLAPDGKRLLEEPNEQWVIGQVMLHHRAGMSCAAIGRRLGDEGVISRTGRPGLPTQSVINIVRCHQRRNIYAA